MAVKKMQRSITISSKNSDWLGITLVPHPYYSAYSIAQHKDRTYDRVILASDLTLSVISNDSAE